MLLVLAWAVFGLLCANIVIDMVEQQGMDLEPGRSRNLMLIGAILGPIWIIIIIIAAISMKKET